eukprot:Clim_evm33s214 gene=Clim_evmTU33s214
MVSANGANAHGAKGTGGRPAGGVKAGHPGGGRGTGSHTRRKEKALIGTSVVDINGNIWHIGDLLGEGGQAAVFDAKYQGGSGRNMPHGQRAWAIKICHSKTKGLDMEKAFAMVHLKRNLIDEWFHKKKRRLGLPYFGGVGRQGDFDFMLIERYGKSINAWLQDGKRSMTWSEAQNVALQLIDTLEYIHNEGYVYADLKGGNILLANKSGAKPEDGVFLVDFGLVKRFQSRGQHLPPNKRPSGFEGTVEYASIDAHRGIGASRRADFECLGYLLMRWMVGTIPWNSMKKQASDKSTHQEKERLREEKEKFRDNTEEQMIAYCRAHKRTKYPRGLILFFRYVYSLRFEETPDYDRLRSLLSDAAMIQLGSSTAASSGAAAHTSNALANGIRPAVEAPVGAPAQKRPRTAATDADEKATDEKAAAPAPKRRGRPPKSAEQKEADAAKRRAEKEAASGAPERKRVTRSATRNRFEA